MFFARRLHQARSASPRFAIFHDGPFGHAHVESHSFLREGLVDEGHAWLGAWLSTHETAGSRGAHLQWHMLVFELATGRWEQALQRFNSELMAHVPRLEALTDGPSALWRLRLTQSRWDGRALPWLAVRSAALCALRTPQTDFVNLHILLALAGAQDVAALTAAIRTLERRGGTEWGANVVGLGYGLLEIVLRRHGAGAERLERERWALERFGGSLAQNTLIADISRWAASRADGAGSRPELGY
jgi:hypothetical protein